MCFTGYRLNWNRWIWIPFPIDSDCTLLCAQVDRTRYSSIASGNNCIVQLCKWLCFITPLVGSVDSTRVLVACSFASVGFFGNNKISTQKHGSSSLKQLNHIISSTISTITGIHSKIVRLTSHERWSIYG